MVFSFAYATSGARAEQSSDDVTKWKNYKATQCSQDFTYNAIRQQILVTSHPRRMHPQHPAHDINYYLHVTFTISSVWRSYEHGGWRCQKIVHFNILRVDCEVFFLDKRKENERQQKQKEKEKRGEKEGNVSISHKRATSSCHSDYSVKLPRLVKYLLLVSDKCDAHIGELLSS